MTNIRYRSFLATFSTRTIKQIQMCFWARSAEILADKNAQDIETLTDKFDQAHIRITTLTSEYEVLDLATMYM